MPDGQAFSVGEPDPPADLDIVVQLHGGLTAFKLGWWPHRELGEAYTHRRLVMTRGSIADLMRLIFINQAKTPPRHGAAERLRL
jgi:hypothetical protein